jgi:hypothetical protein
MAMTRRPTSTTGFIGLQATNTIGFNRLLDEAVQQCIHARARQ